MELISAVELEVLKHCTMDCTHALERLEYKRLGSGGSSLVMRSIDAWSREREALTVKMTFN
jgi:hypothetical protein